MLNWQQESELLSTTSLNHSLALMTSTESLTRKLMTWRVKSKQWLSVKLKFISLRPNKQAIKRNWNTWKHLRRDIDKRILICKEELTLKDQRTWTSQLKSKTLKLRLEFVRIKSFKIERNLMVPDTQILLFLITIQTSNLKSMPWTITLEYSLYKMMTWLKSLTTS